MESHFGQNFRSRIFSDGREFSRTVENFPGRSRIFSDDREFSRTVENFLGRSRIYSDSRDLKFSQTIENASAVCRLHFPPNLINMATQPVGNPRQILTQILQRMGDLSQALMGDQLGEVNNDDLASNNTLEEVKALQTRQ